MRRPEVTLTDTRFCRRFSGEQRADGRHVALLAWVGEEHCQRRVRFWGGLELRKRAVVCDAISTLSLSVVLSLPLWCSTTMIGADRTSQQRR